MHKILDNFFDNNSFFLSMIEKDKIRLLKANVSYEKNNLIKTLLTKIKDAIQAYTKIFFQNSINLSFNV
jgi:hypothetical protein